MNSCGTEKIIAAVRTQAELDAALKSGLSLIFDLNPDIMTLGERVKAAHRIGKRIFIHIDLAAGIGKDKSGMLYVKNIGVDGIISTRANIIKIAHELGLFTVQRFFAVDSQSVYTAAESVKSSKADMIEIMPGVAVKAIEKLKSMMNVPIIAGGLIETHDEVSRACSCGAYAVSTGRAELWSI